MKRHLNLRVHFHNTSKEQDVYQRAWNSSLWRKVTRCVAASRPVSEMAVGMAKTPKATEISKMIGEFIMNLYNDNDNDMDQPNSSFSDRSF